MGYSYWWAPSPVPNYYQFQYNGFYVGCGPVAWTMLFCWADRQAGLGNAYWAPRNGLYRQNGGYGADALAPVSQDSGVENVVREINGDVGTFNLFGSGATWPWRMADAWHYLTGRSYTSLRAGWNSIGWAEDWIRDRARDSIKYRATPAVIGTGWLSHYPMAFGYAYQERIVRYCFIWCWDVTVYDRWFYVDQGWGGAGNEWVSASTWFAGEIFP